MRLGVEAALVDGALVPGDVDVADGDRRGRAGVGGGGRGIAAPGFVDLQVNGFAGVDFMHTDRDGYGRAGEAILATGTTAYQPTFITAGEDDLGGGAARDAGRARRRRADRDRRSRGGAVRLGAAARRAPGGVPPRARTRRCWSGCSTRASVHAGDARARAARRVRADRPAAGARRGGLRRALRRHRAPRRTRRSTAACAPSRTCSTRCARSCRATRGSRSPRSRART